MAFAGEEAGDQGPQNRGLIRPEGLEVSSNPNGREPPPPNLPARASSRALRRCRSAWCSLSYRAALPSIRATIRPDGVLRSISPDWTV